MFCHSFEKSCKTFAILTSHTTEVWFAHDKIKINNKSWRFKPSIIFPIFPVKHVSSIYPIDIYQFLVQSLHCHIGFQSAFNLNRLRNKAMSTLENYWPGFNWKNFKYKITVPWNVSVHTLLLGVCECMCVRSSGDSVIFFVAFLAFHNIYANRSAV